MTKILKVIGSFVSVMLVSATLHAAAGTSGGQFLKIGVNADSGGLGETGSVISGAQSLFLNPAGLNGTEKMEVNLSQVMWLEDISYSNIAFAMRPKACNNRSVFGIGINYLAVPSIDKVDNTGVKTGESFSPRDMAVAVGYAHSLNCGYDLGASVRYISSTLDDKTASAFGLDLGVQKKFILQNLELGLAVQNIGTELKFDKEADPLPLNVKFGGKYVIPINSAADDKLLIKHGFNIYGDANYTNDSGLYGNGGLEYVRGFGGSVSIALRGGYKSNIKGLDNGGMTAGLGLSYNQYILDYAYAPYGDLGQAHRISLSVKF